MGCIMRIPFSSLKRMANPAKNHTNILIYSKWI